MSVHKGITSLEEPFKGRRQRLPHLPGGLLIRPAFSPARPPASLPFQSSQQTPGCGWRGGEVGGQREFGEAAQCGSETPGVGSKGNELTIQAEKDTGRSQGPSPAPVRSELIARPCLPVSHHSTSLRLSSISEVWPGGQSLSRAVSWALGKIPSFQASASPLAKGQG